MPGYVPCRRIGAAHDPVARAVARLEELDGDAIRLAVPQADDQKRELYDGLQMPAEAVQEIAELGMRGQRAGDIDERTVTDIHIVQ